MMMRQYTALPCRSLRPRTSVYSPCQVMRRQVAFDDAAVDVMTDFRQVTAFTVDPEVSADAAARVMRRRNVHLLLVVNVENHILGIITSNDLLGPKPLTCLNTRGIAREEVLVRDIMTAEGELEVIAMDDVMHAQVGHVVATLKTTGRRHAVVVDEDASGRQTLRGLFAASQIAQQLGEPIETIELATNFAEISAALKD